MPFPFDDLTASKVRPAVCLTDKIPPHDHLVLAFITSKISTTPAPSDFVIDKSDPGFVQTGLKISSTIRLHRLVTAAKSVIQRELGELLSAQQTEIDNRLRKPFSL